MDRQRLHPDPGRVHPARRCGRGQVRPAARVPARRRRFRGGVPAVRARPERPDTGGRAGPSGCRGRTAHAGQPRHPAGHVLRAGPRAGHRRLVRTGRDRGGRGPLPGWLVGRGRVLEVGLPPQPTRRGRGGPGDDAPRARESGPGGRAGVGLVGGRPRRTLPQRDHLCARLLG